MASLYSDFDITFLPNSVTKDLATLEDNDAVKQSVRLLVLTSLFERVFQPGLGGEVNKMFFEPLDDISTSVLVRSIGDTLRQFEPRITLQYIDVYTDKKPTGEYLEPHTLWIEIAFVVRNLPTVVTTGVLLQRLR